MRISSYYKNIFYNKKNIILIILIILGIIYRLIQHHPNFSPLAAIALFSGFYFKKAWTAFIPLVILFITDYFIGFYEIKIMVSVYISFAIIAFIGIIVAKNKSALKILFGSITGSVLFFLITNFAVWYFSRWYSHDFQGLINSYTMAIPFFRNTIVGDLFFTILIFGSYEFALRLNSYQLFKMKKALNKSN